MPDYRVRFVGDLNNLAQFDRAIRNSAAESARQLEAANKKIASRVGPISGIFDPKGLDPGLFIRNQRTIIDSYNNTFRQVGETIRRAVKGYEAIFEEGQYVVKPILIDTLEGTYDKKIGNVKAYEEQIKKTANTERAILRESLREAERYAALQNEILATKASIIGYKGQAGQIRAEAIDPLTQNRYSELITKAQKDLLDLQTGASIYVARAKDAAGNYIAGSAGYPTGLSSISSLSRIQGQITEKRNAIVLGQSSQPGFAGKLGAAQIAQLEAEIKYLEGVLRAAPKNIGVGTAEMTAALNDYEKALTRETAGIAAAIATLEAEVKRLELTNPALAAKSQAKIDALRKGNPAYAAAERAARETPPIDANLQKAFDQSAQLKRDLLRGGIGGGYKPGSDEFLKVLAQQEAAVEDFNKNMRTGVTQIRGTARQYDVLTGKVGGVEKFTADIDNNGKVITRWGGQLSGAGGVLRQTVRDFAKVIEWTVATTAVFGTLGLAIKSLGTINELNTALARFAITAQLSAEETKSLFSDLGQVAIDTATPLADLVKVSDDIALATKRAGDSTDEWKAKILDLTRAVGIFTNLTGEDTVQGADKLSSAFKQLGVAPDELLGVLNKVTAVAGGQATAINEIVTALGGVAEAGRAAGLTMDEQIAAVQVLSQVTNKSAADVATAFKNLFGSLASPGSEKILKEFGIQLRDVNGAVRPFLDVYREIKKALETGIIPPNRLNDVLRGISGGPRRAPDAAALLANIGSVDAAISLAANASNEALIANAKILDTNTAKITQFQNAFNIALFEKFGAAVQQFTETLTGALTILLELFNGIDPAMIALLLQFGAFVAAGKLAGVATLGLSSVVKRSFGDIARSIKFANMDLIAFGRQQAITAAGGVMVGRNPLTGARQFRDARGRYQSVNNLPYGTANGLLAIPGAIPGAIKDKFMGLSGKGKVGLGLGLGALIGGADIAATQLGKGGLDPQTIGSVLQFAGALSLATGVLAPLGAAALAAGFAVSVFGNQTDQAKEDTKAAAAEIYDIIQQLGKAQADVVTAAAAQSDASKSLRSLAASGKSDISTKDAQTDATNRFVLSTLQLANANQTVSKSFDELLAKLDHAGGAYAAYKDVIGNAASGPNSAGVQKLAQQIATEILRATGSNIYLPTGPRAPISTTPFKQPPVSLSVDDQHVISQAIFDKGGEFGQLRSLNARNLTELFDANTGQQRYNILPSQENMVALSTALADTITKNPLNLNQEQIDNLVRVVDEFLAANSTFYELTSKLLGDQATIQALGAVGGLRGKDLVNAQTRNSLGLSLKDLLQGADVGGIDTSSLAGVTAASKRTGVTQDDIRTLIKQLTETPGQTGPNFAGLTADELNKIGETLLRLKGTFPEIAAAGNDALRVGILQVLTEAGVPAQTLVDILGALPTELRDAEQAAQDAADALDRLTEARTSAVNKFAARNAALQQADNSGQYDKNAAGLAALKAQSQEAYDAEIQLIDSITALADPAYEGLQIQLSKVIGLENAGVISKENLSAAFIDNALAAGVSAEGIVNLQGKLEDLIKQIDIISRIRATFHIQGAVTMDLKQYIAAMKALRESTIAALKNNPFISPTGGGVAAKGLEQLNAAIAELEAAQAAIGGDIGSINKTIGSGQGSNLGQLPSKSKAAKAAQGPDVSLLDLPDEIANAMNRSALIKEAIKRAKELQSKIPGASKEAQNDIVELLKGTQRILEVRGVKDDLLRKALEELAEIEKKRLEFETKADTIRRIRVGAGSFAAIANVPVNSKTGVSLGGAEGPINVTLNLNGTVLTPAQLAQFADLVAAALKRQISNG